MAAAVAAACTANVSLISNLVTADTSTKYEFEDGVINGTSMEITEDSSASGGPIRLYERRRRYCYSYCRCRRNRNV